MNATRLAATACVGLSVCFGTLVSLEAQVALVPTSPPPAHSHTVVDPRFDAIRQVLLSEGGSSPYFGGAGLPMGTRLDGVGAFLRFWSPLNEIEQRQLEASGVEWQRRGGKIVHVGTVYGAFVRFEALERLRGHGMLRSAEVAWHPVELQPLDVTGAELGVDRTQWFSSLRATGQGVVIGDIDSGIDVLHPHFFRADGGAFAWLDVNGDGELTPLVDAIDYDRDGVAGRNETVRVLDAARVDADNEVQGDDGILDVERDWLFVDANQDGMRNVGIGAGFTEFDPGYGEPAFVPDDADRDGELGLDERVLLLGSSKVERFVSTAHTWQRGVDLIESESASFIGQVLHGSAVASILVGGQPPLRGVGIAPGADLVMYSSHMDAPGGGFEESGHLADLQDAVDRGLSVLVHEWTNPSTALLDGSGNYEAAMDMARTAGLLHVNPVGNLNLSQKHAEVPLLTGNDAELAFSVGGGFDAGREVYPYSSLFGSLHWRGDQDLSLRLVSPLGVVVVLPLDSSVVELGPDRVQATMRQSDRGTRQIQFTLWNPNSETSVTPGDWRFEVSDVVVDDLLVARVADYWSGWSVGVFWLQPTRDHGTVVYPATADGAMGVAAYGGRNALVADGTQAGELRNYSGRGPRIDGAPLVHLAAPDDPFAAWGVSAEWVDSGVGRSWLSTFGGTSGATPHVAGVATLLRAAQPGLTPSDVEEALLGAARRDGATGNELPRDDWGWGKLDALAVLAPEVRPSNAQPIAVLEWLEAAGTVTASASSDPDDDALSFRWDFDYDGEWDTDWSAEHSPSRSFSSGSQHVVRVDVRDEQGGRSGAVLRIDLEEAGSGDPAPDAGADAGLIEPTARRGCGCAASGEASSSLILALWALVLGRRRSTSRPFARAKYRSTSHR